MVSHIALMQALAKFGRDEDGALRLIVTSAGGSPNASFTITRVDSLTNANLIAPAGVYLRASNLAGFAVTEPAGNTNVYDPTQHRMTFIWDFGDTAYTPRFTPNIPTAHRNTNIAYGKSVAHVYATPGNYTVTCWAFDDAGNWGTATYTFGPTGSAGPILNQDASFPTTQTIVYSPSNIWTGEPTGAVRCTTPAQVRTACNNAGSRVRILFRRGETYTGPYTDGGTSAFGRDGGSSIFYGAYGTGNAPVINIKAGGMFYMRDIFGGLCAIDGLDVVGDWDPATETGTERGIFAELGEYMENLVVHRTRFSGLGKIELKAQGNATTVLGCYIFHDTQITNWKDYGILGGTPRRFSIIGCDFAQNVDALMGINQDGQSSQSPTNLGNTHGPIRSGNEAHLYVAATSFFTRGGWSGSGAGGNMQTVTQGCWRFTPDTSITTYRVHQAFDRCSFESAGPLLTVQSVNDPASTGYPRNLLFDKCLFVSTAYSVDGAGNAMLLIRSPGMTIRNSYFYRPDVPRRIAVGHFQNGIVDARLTPGSEAALTDTPFLFYNNTCFIPSIQSRIGTSNPVLFNTTGTVAANVNNVYFAPNLLPAIGSTFAPLGTSPLAGFQCRFKGGRWNPPPIGSPLSPSGRLAVQACRENPMVPQTIQAGPVANGEKILLPYPNYTGTEAHGGYTLNVTQAMILANPTQRHQFSINNLSGKRRTDLSLWPEGENGGITIEFLSSWIRITNQTGTTWTSFIDGNGVLQGNVWLQLDLTAQLMAFDTPSPADVPVPVPGTGSAARNAYTTGFRAREDFFGNVRAGERNTTGTIQGGTADLGAFEIA